MTALVYVLGGEDGTPQKIGVSSSSVDRRLRLLQTGNHEALRINHICFVSSMTEARNVEQYAHSLLFSRSIRGEWFAVSVEEAVAALWRALTAVRRGERLPRLIGNLGRPLLYPDKVVAPLVEGTKARIKVVLGEHEDTTDFLRTAVDAELDRREAAAARAKRKEG